MVATCRGRWWRWLGGLLGSLVLLAGQSGHVLAVSEHCFPETGQCVSGRFLAYWQDHGGLAINGYPLLPERRELLEDGREYTVQYFERVRMEHHPENAPPHDVLLGQLGRWFVREEFGYARYRYDQALAAVPPSAAARHFPETGHNVQGLFLAYWEEHGGLAQFGYPLTEEFMAPQVTGPTLRVQYFERARFEWHPENADPTFQVLLGQFGRVALGTSDRLVGPLGMLYRTDVDVRDWFGLPAVEGTRIAPGATLSFEHGVMLSFLAADRLPRLAVLCGPPEAGRLFGPTRNSSRPVDIVWYDFWQPGMPAGGGPGPRPGTYEPRDAFGKLWREEAAVRECLGYATSSAPTLDQLSALHFSRGWGLTVPSEAHVYLLYQVDLTPNQPQNFYQRRDAPTR